MSTPVLEREARPLLEAEILYEDFVTGLRAHLLLDQVRHWLELSGELRESLWRFDLLAEQEWRRASVEEAVRADLVFVAAHGNGPLPATVKQWAREWLLRPVNEYAAVIVSLDGRLREQEDAISFLAELRSLLGQTVFDFLPCFWDPPLVNTLACRHQAKAGQRIKKRRSKVKPAHQERNAPFAYPQSALKTVPVRIEFAHPTATTVGIAGSFNDWHPGATEMICLGNGHWIKELVLPLGTYEYLLVVDGRWLPDPRAQATVPNPFGGCNCVLVVAEPEAQLPDMPKPYVGRLPCTIHDQKGSGNSAPSW